MHDEIVGQFGQRAIDEMQKYILDAKDLIKHLETEIEGIDKRLTS